MSYFDALSKQDYENVVSLPYRVGVWLSEADDDGGEESDEKEKIALENLINGFTQEVFGSELVQYAMSETWKRKEDWEQWASLNNRVLEDCKIAIDSLSQAFDEKEVNAYKQRLFEIAEAIAQAFREEGNELAVKQDVEPVFNKIKRYFGFGEVHERSWDLHINISPKEREALKKLSKILDI